MTFGYLVCLQFNMLNKTRKCQKKKIKIELRKHKKEYAKPEQNQKIKVVSLNSYYVPTFFEMWQSN